jgi:hypothetical protein
MRISIETGESDMKQVTRLGDIALMTARIAIGALLVVPWPATSEATSPKTLQLCDRREALAKTARRVERAFEKGRLMPISSYDDDPSVAESNVECVDPAGFAQDPHGRPLLSNSRVFIRDEDILYRQDRFTGVFAPWATNPWPLPTANSDGSFRFPDEPRFPQHLIERDAAGRPVLNADGLQIWTPRDLHLGMNTTFEAASKVKDAVETWTGRSLVWGAENGRLEINAHAFVDFNAFFSPASRTVYFGVVPYRFSGQAVIEIFELANSWDIAAHEVGHAAHMALKPNHDVLDVGYQTWSESFADQMAMWASLRDAGRVRSLLAATHGDLRQSNALSGLGEFFSFLVGEGNGLRDAVNDWTVSTTSSEVHDRSEVLTGAAYRFFVSTYEDLVRKGGERALPEAAEILGTFLTRATDFTPENTMTLEDVAKAYLKVDKELYGGRYHARLVAEFSHRELFNANSLAEWLAHEATLPQLRLGQQGVEAATALIQLNLDLLGIGPDFGLLVQSVTREDRDGYTIVRVQLTVGRGPDAMPLQNHGVLVFRANGMLADYHAPLPADVFSQVQALELIRQAQQLRLDRHGAPLSVVRREDGQLTVEARVMRGNALNFWIEAFTLDNPRGEHRDIIAAGYGGPAKTDALKRAGVVLTPDELEK